MDTTDTTRKLLYNVELYTLLHTHNLYLRTNCGQKCLSSHRIFSGFISKVSKTRMFRLLAHLIR